MPYESNYRCETLINRFEVFRNSRALCDKRLIINIYNIIIIFFIIFITPKNQVHSHRIWDWTFKFDWLRSFRIIHEISFYSESFLIKRTRKSPTYFFGEILFSNTKCNFEVFQQCKNRGKKSDNFRTLNIFRRFPFSKSTESKRPGDFLKARRSARTVSTIITTFCRHFSLYLLTIVVASSRRFGSLSTLMWKYRSSRSPSLWYPLFASNCRKLYSPRTLVTKVNRSTPEATPAAFPTALSLRARSSPCMY